MRLFILLLAITFSFPSAGQETRSHEAKKARYANGKSLDTYDPIDWSQDVVIKEKGRLTIVVKNGYAIEFNNPGRYSLDSAYKATIQTREYLRRDSVYKANWYRHCPEVFHCGYCNRFKSKDEINHDHEIVMVTPSTEQDATVDSPLVRLEWKYPTSYDKTYYLILKTFFDEEIAVEKTTNTYFDVDLSKIDGMALIYRIVSEECIQTGENAVRLKTR